VANGTDTFTYTAQVVDGNGNPVTEAGMTVNWSQDKGEDVTLPATSTTNASGEATITLTSTTKAVADITVNAKVGTTAAVDADKTVSFTYDISTAKVSTVTLNDDTQSKVANGTDTFTYTAQVVDGNGNPVTEAGVTVNWSQDKGEDVTLPATSTTNDSGEATITLTSTTKLVADITVSANVGTTAVVNADKTVSFTYGEVALITFVKINDTTLNGETTATAVVGTQPTLKLVVQDAYGHDIPNQTLDLSVSGNASIYPDSVNTNAAGEISKEILMADKKAEIVTVTATLSGSAIKGTLAIEFVPGPISSDTSTIEAEPNLIKLDESLKSKVIYVPKDEFGNVIKDIDPSKISADILGMDDDSLTLSGWSYKDGQYTATVTPGEKTGSLRVIPLVNGTEGVSRNGENILTLIAGNLDTSKSSIKAVPPSIIANGDVETELQFIPRDTYGNVIDWIDVKSISQVISGKDIETGSDIDLGVTVGEWSYNANSQWYRASLRSGTQPGIANIMPTVNGDNAIEKNKEKENGVIETLTLDYSSSVTRIEVASKGTAIADGKQTNKVTVTIFGPDGQAMSDATVNLIPPNEEDLLINGNPGAYTGTTNDEGQLTVTMASTLIGDNNFTVESDRYTQAGVSTFGIYVSPESSVGFSTRNLVNNGEATMTVTFYPVDAKGRALSTLGVKSEDLGVTFESSDTEATLTPTTTTPSGYQTTVKSTSNPGTFFINITIDNYSQWQVPKDDPMNQYSLIPDGGVFLAKIIVNAKLCASSATKPPYVNSYTACSPTDNAEYYHSGLGFIVHVEKDSPAWIDKSLELQSIGVSGNLELIARYENASNNCSADTTSPGSWMNDFGNSSYALTIDFSNKSTFDTFALGAKDPGQGGGIGSCEIRSGQSSPAVEHKLKGSGDIQFKIKTVSPESEVIFSIPISNQRIDAGKINSPVTLNLYSPK
ncbi:invasin domain 3-containing protein, partial [Providencia rettgeri]